MKALVLFLVSVAILGVILDRVSKVESFQFLGELVASVNTSEKIIALTFDDGPTIGKTEAILKILRDNETKATFYLVGEAIAKNQHQAGLIAQGGHEIGNHSYTHKRMSFTSLSFVSEELEKTNREIRKIGYEGQIHFRPPYGRKLLALPYYLKKNDILSVTWDVEPDSVLGPGASAEELVEYTLKHTKPGSIILMHVMFKSRRNSLKAIPGIIQGLKSKGYRFVTVSELLNEYDT